MTEWSGWVGVDLDGTLAHYDGWKGDDVIGAPIPAMVDRVKALLERGVDVRIFTARVTEPWTIENGFHQSPVSGPVVVKSIQAWCVEHIGQALPVTNMKDHQMVALFDDRAYRVEKNTGVIVGPEPTDL